MPDFSVPDFAPAPDVPVETRPRQLQAWLDHLPFASPADAARQLLAALRAMNRVALDATLRESLLARYRPAIARATAGLERLLGEAGVPPYAQTRQHAALLCALAHEHTIGYKRLLCDPAPNKSGRRSEWLAQLLAALRALQDAHALTYTVPPPNLWPDMHRAHALARSVGRADDVLGDARPASLAYREALLTALADPARMSRSEFFSMRAFLRAYGALTTLRDGPPGETGFAIDPANPAPPTVPAATATGLLWLDTEALCRRLHELALRLRDGDPPGSLGLPDETSKSMALLVAKRLSKRWRSCVRRVYARREADGATLDAVAGLSAIHRLLAGDPDEDGDGQSIGDVAALYAAPATLHVSRWTVRNDSATGLSLTGTPGTALNLRAGDALALRAIRHADWSLAMIRWVTMHDGGRVELGVERIAPGMQPVWVRLLRGPRKHPEPALLVPGLAGLKQRDRLMLPSQLYAAGMDAEIRHASRQYVLSFGRRLEHTPSFDLIDFTLFARNPDVA